MAVLFGERMWRLIPETAIGSCFNDVRCLPGAPDAPPEEAQRHHDDQDHVPAKRHVICAAEAFAAAPGHQAHHQKIPDEPPAGTQLGAEATPADAALVEGVDWYGGQ